MAKKVQEVKAETIDPPEIVSQTLVEREIARAEQEAATWGERFVPYEPTDDATYKQLKNDAAAFRRSWNGIKNHRKELVAPVKSAVRSIERGFDPVIDRGKAIDQHYRDYQRGYERSVVDANLSQLAKYYEDLAPAMAEQVPFERIDAKCGEADGWHKPSASIVKMQEQLQGHCQEIADTERQIVALSADLPDEDTDRWRSEYFRTLDYKESSRIAQEAREQRERLKALDAERQAREAWERERQAQAEPYVPDESYVPTEDESAPQTPVGQAPDDLPKAAKSDGQTASQGQVTAYRYLLVAVPEEQLSYALAALKSIPGSHGKPVAGEEWWK